MPPETTIRDNPDARRYELTVDGELAGFSQYRLADRTITFTHTLVDPAFEGRGLGSQLARAVLDDARRRGLRVIPHCPFIASYIASHAAYADLLSDPPPDAPRA